MAQGHGTGHEGETVRRILEAAAREFALHGFAAARIRDIVDMAGVNLAAVNYHFGGKEGLYRDTVAMLARQSQREAPRDSPEVLALPPEDQLRILARVLAGRFLEGPQATAIARILAHEFLDPTPAFDTLLRDVAGPQLARLCEIVAALLGPRADDEEVLQAGFSVMGQCACFLFGHAAAERLAPGFASAPRRIDVLARRAADFSIAGIRARRLELEAPSESKAGSVPHLLPGGTRARSEPARPGRLGELPEPAKPARARRRGRALGGTD